MKGPLSIIFDLLPPVRRISETYRIFILTNVAALLSLAVMIPPLIAIRHERAEAEKLVAASQIAEVVMDEAASRLAGVVMDETASRIAGEAMRDVSSRESVRIPAGILSLYEEGSAARAGFEADARITRDWRGGMRQVEVSVRWLSYGEQKQITIIKAIETSAQAPRREAARPNAYMAVREPAPEEAAQPDLTAVHSP